MTMMPQQMYEGPERTSHVSLWEMLGRWVANKFDSDIRTGYEVEKDMGNDRLSALVDSMVTDYETGEQIGPGHPRGNMLQRIIDNYARTATRDGGRGYYHAANDLAPWEDIDRARMIREGSSMLDAVNAGVIEEPTNPTFASAMFPQVREDLQGHEFDIIEQQFLNDQARATHHINLEEWLSQNNFGRDIGLSNLTYAQQLDILSKQADLERRLNELPWRDSISEEERDALLARDNSHWQNKVGLSLSTGNLTDTAATTLSDIESGNFGVVAQIYRDFDEIDDETIDAFASQAHLFGNILNPKQSLKTMVNGNKLSNMRATLKRLEDLFGVVASKQLQGAISDYEMQTLKGIVTEITNTSAFRLSPEKLKAKVEEAKDEMRRLMMMVHDRAASYTNYGNSLFGEDGIYDRVKETLRDLDFYDTLNIGTYNSRANELRNSLQTATRSGRIMPSRTPLPDYSNTIEDILGGVMRSAQQENIFNQRPQAQPRRRSLPDPRRPRYR